MKFAMNALYSIKTIQIKNSQRITLKNLRNIEYPVTFDTRAGNDTASVPRSKQDKTGGNYCAVRIAHDGASAI